MLVTLLIIAIVHGLDAFRLFGTRRRRWHYIEKTRRLRRSAGKPRTVSPPRTVISDADGLRWFETTPGDLMALRVHSRDVAGAFTIVEARVLPLSGPPMHIHRERDEIFEVLEGRFRFSCAGDVFDLSAGTTIVVPRGVPHAWVNLGRRPARLLFSFVPGGIDELFEKIAKTPPDQCAALAALHDTWITGPPLVIDGAAEPCRERHATNVLKWMPRP
jgi:quercetin dioxygenase-like cupin family protein